MCNIAFVNIHSHKPDVGQAVSITNVFVQNRREICPQAYYSLGLHPWHISEIAIDFDLEEILNHYIETDTSLVAIGEIGLDRAIAVPFELQTTIFEKQLLLAQSHRLPVIIHCVRAYSELIRCKKKWGITVPLIIHGYCGNEIITKELLKHGFYFSFGKALFQKHKNALEAVTMIPLDRLFLETDNSDFSIEELYQCLSEQLGISLQILKERLFENFQKCFLHDKSNVH